MKPKHSRQIGNLLNKRELSHLEHKVTQLKRINQSFQAILPAEFKGKCEVANLKEQELVIGTEVHALATRLNLTLPSLIQTLRTQGHGYISKGKVIILGQKTGFEKAYWSAEKPNIEALERLKKQCDE